MKYKYFLILLLLACLTVQAGAAFCRQKQTVEVTVTGVEGAMLDNVLSGLCLAAQKNNERLTPGMIKRCYDQAETEIAQGLEPFGYYSPEIDTSLTRDGDAWKAEFKVAPGEPVRVAGMNIQLTGQGLDDPALADAVTQFPLKSGDILDHRLYEQGKKDLSSAAVTAGYRNATFRKSVVKVDRTQRAADIFLTLATGPRYLFGSTTFAADFLSTGLLNRMLPYAAGDPFSPRKIVRLRQAFLNSDYFDRVDVDIGEPDPGSLHVPVFIELSPKNPNRYELGVGYGTDTGVRGSVGWTNRLLNQYGHQLNLRLQASERKNNIGGVYTIPVYDPKTNRLSLQGEWQRETYDNTDTEQINTAVSYDRLKENSENSIYLEFLDEDYEIGSESGHATLLKPGFRTSWRWADDRLRTRNGIGITLDLTGAGQDVVSDVTFLQASVYSKAILTLFEQWRLIGRMQLGGILVDNLSDLPPSLRFYAGGDQSVRGYAYKSIGPTDPEGDVVGASHLFVYSLELERKLFGNWSAAVFFDSGDATNSLTDLNMKRGAGVGLRWNAPFGQVRFDVANAVSEGDRSWRIHFNVGADL